MLSNPCLVKLEFSYAVLDPSLIVEHFQSPNVENNSNRPSIQEETQFSLIHFSIKFFNCFHMNQTTKKSISNITNIIYLFKNKFKLQILFCFSFFNFYLGFASKICILYVQLLFTFSLVNVEILDLLLILRLNNCN